MSARETGKDRAARIPYNYLRAGRDSQIRWRLRATGLAVTMAAGWLVYASIGADAGRLPISHGPLASSHAIWESQCDACHVKFPGVRAADWHRSYGIASQAGDARCQSCHMGQPEQAHHRTIATGAEPHCASCHGDHQGRNASLVRRDDAQCTSCHKDLQKSLASDATLPRIHTSIAHFYGDTHPGFRGADADPGRIKFNHYLHMNPGLRIDEKSAAVFTFLQFINPSDRARYGWRDGLDLATPVKLECTSCHRLDDHTLRSSGSSHGAPVPRSSGGYFAPITYQAHCTACHPLAAPGRVATATITDPVHHDHEPAEGERWELLRIPHGLQPDELHDELTARFTAYLLKEDHRLLDELKPQRLGGPDERAVAARREVEGRVRSTERILLGRGKASCTECHYYATTDGKSLAGARAELDPARMCVAASSLPARWFEHAVFNHSAHRALDCRSCHPRADPDDPRASGRPSSAWLRERRGAPTLDNGKATWTAHEDVLLPGIQVCQSCHAPAGRAGSVRSGGASFDCTECHTYHNGDRPREGSGASARGPREKRELVDFLRGVSTSERRPAP